MRGKVTRRDLLKLAGGSAVGVLLTPIPWKLTDDLAIWTQNWSRIPKLPRGPVSEVSSHCTLCPASCGIRLRSVAGVPVAIAPRSGHPVSRGALCPLAFGSHQLPWHPARLREPADLRVDRGVAGHPAGVTTEEVAAAVAFAAGARRSGEILAFLDTRPGRAASNLYRRILAEIPGAVHVAVPSAETRSLDTISRAFGGGLGPMGYDLDRTRLVLSFGAPLLEGWAGPAASRGLRVGSPGGSRPRIVQIETRPSTTALRADRWLRPRPGTELAIALGLAHVLLRDGLVDGRRLRASAVDLEGVEGFRELVRPYSPERVARIADLAQEDLVRTARELATTSPAVAVGGGDPGAGPLGRDEEIAIAALNLLVGSVGVPGGILARRELPDAPAPAGSRLADTLAFEDLPDHAARVVIVDAPATVEALPAAIVRGKLRDERSLLVSLSPWATGLASHADVIVPAPSWLERLEEAPSPPWATRASFGLSAPMLPAPPRAVEPVELLRAIARTAGARAGEVPTAERAAEERVRAIHESGRGRIVRFGGDGQPIEERPGQLDPLVAGLRSGAVWIDDDAPAIALPSFRLMGPDPDAFRRLAAAGSGPIPSLATDDAVYPLALVPFALRGAAGAGPVPVLASKLYRESGLGTRTGVVLVHPMTATRHGVRDGAAVIVETPAGEVKLLAVYDRDARPGVLHAAVGPDPACAGEVGPPSGEAVAHLCARDVATWRGCRARIREA